jgi:ATP-binding cassette subfamily F protein uup
MPPVSILLSARDLSYSFGARTLFEGVNFTLSEGDRVGLIGPNGAGKSTLLGILAGKLSPDKGGISRRGSLRIAHLAQIPDLADVTVREAVHGGLPAADAAGWEGDARVDEWLSRLNLEADAPVARLSGGWRKKVALARALVAEPEVLLLDEPTSALDETARDGVERTLAELAGAGVSMVLVTHDRGQAERLTSRVIELSEGRVAA